MKRVVVVDGLSTGWHYPPALRARGAEPLHVLSRATIPERFLARLDVERYAGAWSLATERFDDVVAALRALAPCAVVAGAETGVAAADALAAALGLPGNDPGTSTRRRDKYDMIEAIRAAGLAAARQVVARGPDQVDAAVAAWPVDAYPAVVKPIDSSGTDGVSFVSDPAAAGAALASLLGRDNQMGERNRGAVLQQRLVGAEYSVNAVSVAGRHKITDVWRNHKRPAVGAAMIYDFDELLPSDAPGVAALTAYTGAALDALGVAWGASHSEVMLTSTGPVLVECGARLQGSMDPELLRRAQGHSQLDEAVAALLDPDPAAWAAAAARPRHLVAAARAVLIVAEVDGIGGEDDLATQLRALPTLQSLRLFAPPGAAVTRTVDLFTSLGDAFLCGAAADVARDTEAIRARTRAWIRPR